MGKKLSIKDKIILAILFASDQFIEFLDYCENPYKKRPYLFKLDLTQEYLEKIYKRDSFYQASSKLKKENIQIDLRHCKLLIDPQSFRSTYYWRKVKLIKDGVKWDGFWRLVIFDIPEKHRKVRAFLRFHLKSLGFVMWQKSVWVTIFDVNQEIRKVLKRAKLENYVLVMEARSIGNLDNKKIIKKLFPVSRINNNYLSFINSASSFDKVSRERRALLVDGFLKTVMEDPGIPDEFFSPKDIRRKALSCFQGIVRRL